MNRTTTPVVWQTTQPKTFRHDTLASERSIPMKLDTKNLISKLAVGRG